VLPSQEVLDYTKKLNKKRSSLLGGRRYDLEMKSQSNIKM